ncbi:MAG: nucleoside deaminase [Victivallaceae bacterium]|nr:nucleoside deaminase [Victivallaceae bacterium]
MNDASDSRWMLAALAEAQKAFDFGEVPIGAVAVENGSIIATGRNRVEEKHSVTAHAELEVLRAVELIRHDWRMHGVTIYVTKEPCPMCAGALVNARCDRIVFGASDPAFGGCGGAVAIPEIPGALYHPEVSGGVESDASLDLLRRFFRERREKKNQSSLT